MPNTTPEARQALLLGATGLIGSFLLDRLLDSPVYSGVSVWLRKPLAKQHPKLQQKIVDFERLEQGRVEADDVYCCLGTTINVAGSREAFRRVDFDYPLAIARTALAAGARQFLFVSAMGADPRSAVFYSRVKGELEEAVAALGYRSAIAFRPSLLAGDREQRRFGERAAIAVLQPLRFLVPRKYRPVAADAVARAMLRSAQRSPAGFTVIESDALQ